MSFEQVCVACGDPVCFGPSGRHQPMTAPVPDRRFRDQLAGWLFDFSMKARGVAVRWADQSIGVPGDDEDELVSDRVLRAAWRSEADALIEDVIAAEVEARVQAAGNQRVVEELERAVREDAVSTHRLNPIEVLTLRVVKVEDLLARVAALASPAPAPPHHRKETA